jgi:hypothetical protein
MQYVTDGTLDLVFRVFELDHEQQHQLGFQ